MTNTDKFNNAIKLITSEHVLHRNFTLDEFNLYCKNLPEGEKYLITIDDRKHICVKGVYGIFLCNDSKHETLTYKTKSLWYNDEFSELFYSVVLEGCPADKLVGFADKSAKDPGQSVELLKQCTEAVVHLYTINQISQPLNRLGDLEDVYYIRNNGEGFVKPVDMFFIHASKIHSIGLVVGKDGYWLEAIVKKQDMVMVTHPGDLHDQGYIKGFVDYDDMDEIDEVLIEDNGLFNGSATSILATDFVKDLALRLPHLLTVEFENLTDRSNSVRLMTADFLQKEWQDLALGINDKTPINFLKPAPPLAQL